MRRVSRPLIVLSEDPTLAERMRDAAGERFEVDTAEGWDELADAVWRAPPAAIALVDPYLGQNRRWGGPSPRLYRILQEFPSATVVAALEVGPESGHDLRLLTEWGVAEILQLEADRTSEAVVERLLSARSRFMRDLLEGEGTEGRLHLTGRARSLIDAAIDTVMTGGNPRDLADALGFSPSTLLRWCKRSQLPPPRRLLLWMRMVFASALLDDPGHNISTVGQACGYSGDQAFRRALRAVLPYTPGELRERGAFATVSTAFFEELARLSDDEAQRR